MIAPLTLSIVIPVYRSEATIGPLVRALDVLQIAGGFEIVLVNGRRVIVPATIDPDSLARLLPVLERT